jgi:two-component system cell cycle response regulator DivK
MRTKLLIAEDTELDRDLLVQIFEGAYEIELAEDGEAAVRLAESAKPDLILMDIGLPGLSGLDAVRAIRARTREVPIVAVSSHVMPGERELALQAGCDDFVSKPIDDLALLEIVRRLLERR